MRRRAASSVNAKLIEPLPAATASTRRRPGGLVVGVPAEALPTVRTIVPDTVELRVFPAEDPTETARTVADMSFLVADFFRRSEYLGMLNAASNLRVVQTLLSGTDWIADHLAPTVTLCNGRGTRDIPVAEWVIAALAGAASGLLTAAQLQERRSWTQFERAELAGSTVAVFGMGSIGATVRRYLEAMSVTVVGIGSTSRNGVLGIDSLPEVLPVSDAVVMLLPLTAATRKLVDAEFLAQMRDGALLVNAGRGAVVDTEALMQELRRERLRAVLDVVDPEPLPSGHELWRLPGVTLSPHIAGHSFEAEQRAWRLAGTQIRRFAGDEPLVNVVSAPRDADVQ